MSWQALGWAWSQQLDDPAAKLLLVALADKANEDGMCWPGQQTLQHDVEVSERTLRRRLRQLEEAGYLAIERKRSSGGKLGGNVYNLQLSNHRPEVADGGSSHRPGVADGPPARGGRREKQPPVVQPNAVATPQHGAATAGSSKRKPDLLWDTFTDLLGEPTNDSERGKRNRALKAIRQSLQAAGIDDPQLQAAALRQRVLRAQQAWGTRGITVTELAVAGNWRTLGSDEETYDPTNLTAQQIMAKAKELRDAA